MKNTIKAKLTALLISAAMLPMGSFAASAADSYDFTLYADGGASAAVSAGDEVEITLAIEGDEDYTFYSMQDYVKFDTDYFELDEDSITVKQQLNSSGLYTDIFSAVPIDVYGAGYDRIFINRVSLTGIAFSAKETILTFTLTALQDGVTDITHYRTEMLDSEGSRLTVNENTATVTIGDATPSPTTAPTASPEVNPTAAPTTAPTAASTTAPTATPAVLTVSSTPAASNITRGSTLSKSTLSGGTVVNADGETVSGSWAWLDGTETMSSTGTYERTAVFTADDDTYGTVEVTVSVKVYTSSGGSSSSSSGTSSATAYTINVDNSVVYGTAEANTSTAKAGDTVTIKISPVVGYSADNVTVTDSYGNKIEVTQNADGTYSFVMPSSEVSIDVEYIETDGTSDADGTDTHDTCPSEPYTDVDTSL
ncbi:MAG: hypothetical protein LIO53_02805 [Oscillospiraceae bacterium]|nr:hypothetical protein [Oscillospiraceae bacterium]